MESLSSSQSLPSYANSVQITTANSNSIAQHPKKGVADSSKQSQNQSKNNGDSSISGTNNSTSGSGSDISSDDTAATPLSSLAGIEIRYLVNYIGKQIDGYYVSNIYSVDRNSVLFKLHHPEKADILLMFSTFGLWFTSKKIEKVEENSLTRRLRTDLLRSKMTKITQLGSERIVYLTFSNLGEEFVLVGEFFGEGNIVLCNSDMKVLALLRSIEVRHRQVKVGLQYTPPPTGGINVFQFQDREFLELPRDSNSTVRWLGRSMGFPTRYTEEVIWRAGVDPRKPSKDLNDEEMQNILQTVKDLVTNITNGKHQPRIINDGKKRFASPITLYTIEGYPDQSENVLSAKGNNSHDNDGATSSTPEDKKVQQASSSETQDTAKKYSSNGKATSKQVQSFMDGLDTIFTDALLAYGKNLVSTPQQQKIREYEHKLEEQLKAINAVKQKSQRMSDVAKSLQEIAASKGVIYFSDSRVSEELEKQNAVITKDKGITSLDIEGEKIPVNLNNSLYSVASILFNESKKQLNAINTIEKAKKKTQKLLDEYRKKEIVAKEAVTYSTKRKKEWYERYRWFSTSEGYLVIGGRDAGSNSSIVRRHLAKDDIVFHADIFGSPFFVIKNGSQCEQSSIDEVAQATACFSRAWKEGMSGLSAYWVYPDQISLGAPSGQFVAKGSFIIEGKRNYIKTESMQLSVGLIKREGTRVKSYQMQGQGDGGTAEQDGEQSDSTQVREQYTEYVVACGPTQPIKKTSAYYVTIEPTGLPMVSVAKKIRSEFLKFSEEEDVVKAITVDDLSRVLPSGESHVVFSGYGQGEIK